jgi:hypothetical protein
MIESSLIVVMEPRTCGKAIRGGLRGWVGKVCVRARVCVYVCAYVFVSVCVCACVRVCVCVWGDACRIAGRATCCVQGAPRTSCVQRLAPVVQERGPRCSHVAWGHRRCGRRGRRGAAPLSPPAHRGGDVELRLEPGNDLLLRLQMICRMGFEEPMRLCVSMAVRDPRRAEMRQLSRAQAQQRVWGEAVAPQRAAVDRIITFSQSVIPLPRLLVSL